jgi:hypothetical protein
MTDSEAARFFGRRVDAVRATVGWGKCDRTTSGTLERYNLTSFEEGRKGNLEKIERLHCPLLTAQQEILIGRARRILYT